MIRNIIFDIGMVLAEFRWREFLDSFGFSRDVNERVAKATVLSPYWNEMDRGAQSLEEIIDQCVLLDPEVETQIRTFFEDHRGIVVEFDYARDWLLELKKQGYGIYLLSNYGERNFGYVKEEFSFIPIVDGMVISYEVKKTKPEPEIYQILLDKYHLEARECVFLDDVEKNIRGAKDVGMQGIQFHSIKQAKEALHELGVG